MRGALLLAFALLPLIIPLIFLNRVYNPSVEETTLRSGGIYSTHLVSTTEVDTRSFLLLNVNDTVLLHVEPRGCNITGYNLTFVHLSTGERYGVEVEGGHARCCPLFTAPKEGVYLLYARLRVMGKGECMIITEGRVTSGDRSGYGKLYGFEAVIGLMVFSAGGYLAFRELRTMA
ncbi:MAG: hypothetical protein ACP5II_06035 [Infirmifilum sp.]|uniref:hypothetical protein n=1 Tax=Infirmifilum TaxID=2856573 RepID=UPI003C75CCB5